MFYLNVQALVCQMVVIAGLVGIVRGAEIVLADIVAVMGNIIPPLMSLMASVQAVVVVLRVVETTSVI